MCARCFAVILLLASASLAAEDFEIKFVRPVVIGNKYKITTTVSKDETVSVGIDGKKLPEARSITSVDLTALVEFLRYDAEARTGQKKYIIESCTKSSGREKSEILKKDQVVVATGSGEKTSFDIDNQTAPDDLAKLLDLVISAQPSTLSEDEVFGSLERKQVGDVWPVRIHALKKSLEKLGFPTEPQTLTGTVKLAAIKEIDGVRCLSIVTQVQIGKVIPYEFAPGQKIEKMEISMDAIIDVPIKRGSNTAHTQKTMSMAVTTIEDRNGKKVQSEVSIKQTEETHYRDANK